MKTLLEKMKYFLMLSLALLFLTQCGDDEGDIKVDNLPGTWTVSEVTFEFDPSLAQFFQDLGLEPADAQAAADAFEDDFEEGFEGTFEFREDNTYESSFADGNESGTWTLSSDGLTLTLNPDLDTDDNVVLEVITLNSSTLKVSQTESESDDFNGDGTEETLTITTVITLTKAS